MIASKIESSYVDEGFGFPVKMTNAPVQHVRGDWFLNVSDKKYTLSVLLDVIFQNAPMTGNHIRFIRKYQKMTHDEFTANYHIDRDVELTRNSVTGLSWEDEKGFRQSICREYIPWRVDEINEAMIKKQDPNVIMSTNGMVKQVIVIRKDLKMRRGKEIAQGCHGSIAFLTKKLKDNNSILMNELSRAEIYWLQNSFAKICVKVNSNEELLAIRDYAQKMEVNADLIRDSGKTEFHNKPTHTCVCIGPDYSFIIDHITGNLSLY